jgi:hypothetical protein
LKKSRLYLGLELQKRAGCFWNHRRDHFDASGVSACFDKRRNCAQNSGSPADRETANAWIDPVTRPDHQQHVFNFLRLSPGTPAAASRRFIVCNHRLESPFARNSSSRHPAAAFSHQFFIEGHIVLVF